MKVRASIAAVSATALLGGAGAIAIAATASADITSHTLTFISVTGKTVSFSKTNFGQQDTDVNSKGKIVGFDMLNITVNPKTGKGTILATVDAKGGFLIGVLPFSNSKTLHGLVTGGVGTFKGASGTIVTKALNKAGTRIAVTITYHT